MAAVDMEKTLSAQQTEIPGNDILPARSTTPFQRFNAQVNALAGFESRDLVRVPLSERQPASTHGLIQMLPKFNTSLESAVTGRTLAANRLSFFSLMFYVPNSWAAAASDYYVTMPENTPKWKTFTLTLLGLVLSFWFVNLLGIGLASGMSTVPAWEEAYSISSGALITAGYAPLGASGKFCAVVVGLGVLANCTPGTYSAALDCQIMGRWGEKVPRWIWVIVLGIVQLVCGLAGRNKLLIVFTNFLALMAYWLMFMICIFIEEHLIFKPRLPKIDWDVWANPKQMPVGWAALAAFLVGWVGAVLGMYQVYFVGPLAVACSGADVGLWVGCGMTLIVFPPLRWAELKWLRRWPSHMVDLDRKSEKSFLQIDQTDTRGSSDNKSLHLVRFHRTRSFAVVARLHSNRRSSPTPLQVKDGTMARCSRPFEALGPEGQVK